MRPRPLTPAVSLGLPCFLLGCAMAVACGQSSANGPGFSDAGADSSSGDDVGILGEAGIPDVGVIGDGGCTGLKCQWQRCSTMGAQQETALTGTVYDPAGNLPLYNVYVYVPNTTPEPIPQGNPQCTPCEAVATGEPIIGAQTDSQGHFKIQWTSGDSWGVPSGANIPLVIQTGKWRKQLTIPLVTACQTNDLDGVFNSGMGKSRQLRLPANGSEGDMPLIAFTSGIDPAECFLRDIGIDDSEFVAPDSPMGPMNGHVHFFTSYTTVYDKTTQGNDHIPSTSVVHGNTPQQTYQWWSSASNLLQYDIVFNACEGDVIDRGSAAYTAMAEYLNGGGRLFATHYYYNWFAPPTGPVPFQSAAQWRPENASTYSSAYYIDTSFPKGEAYGEWLLGNGIATGSMAGGVQIALGDTRADVQLSGPPLYTDSARWIYNAGGPGPNGAPPAQYSTAYVSFNTPTGAPTNQQCGRAVFSDVHLSGTVTTSPAFPTECNGVPDYTHVNNEKALEFLFFDLTSCVQDETMPPPPPPTR